MGESTPPFSAAQLEQANLALSNGIRIEDPVNDFYHFSEGSIEPDGLPNNPNPYPLAYTDLKSLTVGADQQYLYVKFEFYGKFPTGPASYNGDAISGSGAKLVDFSFVNKEGKAGLAELVDSVHYTRGVEQYTLITPKGIDIYETVIRAGSISGGPGYDYVIGAYPLSVFGISYGQEVTFSSATETGSSIYHHEVVDVLLGQEGSKFGATIKYKLGDNAYEVLAIPSDFDEPPAYEEAEPSLITPYVDAGDMASINEAYSSSENAPWGFAHGGVDFFPTGDLKPFRAVCSGTIGEFRLWQQSENSNWQVNVCIEFNSTFTVSYAFEPFSAVQVDGQAQLDNMLVTSGQYVEQGDIIGYLVAVGGGAHVDFGLIKGHERVSPENYFTPEALESILEILHRTFPGASLTYP